MKNKKRFTIEIDDENFTHILDTNVDIGQYNLCRVLNELHDENNELKQLLEEIKYELTCIHGLIACDRYSDYLGYIEVFKDDIIDLNYGELLKKIDKVIK